MDLFVEIENAFQLKNHCRLCALYYDEEHLIQISQYNLITSSKRSEIMDATNFIEKSIDIRINDDPTLPKQICQQCLDILINFFQFKLKCHDAEEILKGIVNNISFEKKNDFLFEENVFDKTMDPFDDVLEMHQVDILNDNIGNIDQDICNQTENVDSQPTSELLVENKFVCLDCREVN